MNTARIEAGLQRGGGRARRRRLLVAARGACRPARATIVAVDLLESQARQRARTRRDALLQCGRPGRDREGEGGDRRRRRLRVRDGRQRAVRWSSRTAITARGGTTVTAGLPNPTAKWDAAGGVSLIAEERTIKGSYVGSCVPPRDMPRFIAMYRAGRLPVDRLLSERIGARRHQSRARPARARRVDPAGDPDAIVSDGPQRRRPWSAYRLHRRRRRHGGLPAGQPAVRGPGEPGAAARGGRARRLPLDPHPGRLPVLHRQSAHRLAVLAPSTKPGPQRTLDQVSARQGARRLLVDQRHDLHARPAPRLRRVGRARQPGLGLGRGAAVLPAPRGPPLRWMRGGTRSAARPRRRVAGRSAAHQLGRCSTRSAMPRRRPASRPATDFNRGDNFGCGYFEVNQKRGVRWNASKAFLRPVAASPEPEGDQQCARASAGVCAMTVGRVDGS